MLIKLFVNIWNRTSLYDRGPASRKDGLQLIVICNKITTSHNTD